MIDSEPQKQIDVLIIEDEIDICYLLTGILSKNNLHTSHVTTLASAKKLLASQHPDILFIDNHLPDGLGVDFISQVKKKDPHTKIVMITAHDTTEDKLKALKEGADYFIGKPFTRETVLNTINNLLSTISD